jgi:phosphoglycolate phosphatase-like HAD superfamily hydrolase
MSDYEVLETIRGDAYLRKDSKKSLRSLDAIIFDCDGVLIDVRESYNACVVKTTLFLFNQLTGIDLPEYTIPKDVLYSLKKSGGFNNDWDMTYAILVSMLCELPLPIKTIKRDLKDLKSLKQKKKSERIKSITSPILVKNNFQFDIEKFTTNLRDYVVKLDTTGINSIRKILSNQHPTLVKIIDEFLMYPGEVGESLLTTVFEELFCGRELFRKIYDFEQEFWDGEGLINKEKKITTTKTFDELELLIGRRNFGVASGRPESLARYTLGKVIKRFKENALMFLEIVEEAEKVAEKPLKKPHPYPLVMASFGLKPFKSLVYIGDSMEDLLMVEYASKLGYKFNFIGVYSCNDLREETVSDFKNKGADIILPTVNELPFVLNKIRSGSV